MKRWSANPIENRRAPIVSARSARIGPKLWVVRWKTPSEGSNSKVKPPPGDGSGHAHELADQREAELAEVELEVADEVRRVRLLAG